MKSVPVEVQFHEFLQFVNTDWLPLPSQFHLANHQVHIWRANLDFTPSQLQPLAQFLSNEEQQRAIRFRFDHDRRHFTAGRGLLRWILSQYLSIAPDQLAFTYAAKGKPSLADHCNTDGWQFNLSHSQGLALYAISQHQRVGIDLERVRTIDAIQLADRFFTPQEAAYLKTLSPSQQQLTFFRYWTCKEAYLKACGDGLVGLDQVEILLNDPVQLVKVGDDRNDHWHLQELHPHPDYAAAIATEGTPTELSFWQYAVQSVDQRMLWG